MVSKTPKHKSTTLNKLLVVSQMLKKEEKRQKEEGNLRTSKAPPANYNYQQNRPSKNHPRTTFFLRNSPYSCRRRRPR